MQWKNKGTSYASASAILHLCDVFSTDAYWDRHCRTHSCSRDHPAEQLTPVLLQLLINNALFLYGVQKETWKCWGWRVGKVNGKLGKVCLVLKHSGHASCVSALKPVHSPQHEISLNRGCQNIRFILKDGDNHLSSPLAHYTHAVFLNHLERHSVYVMITYAQPFHWGPLLARFSSSWHHYTHRSFQEFIPYFYQLDGKQRTKVKT